jgi:hypothetical protein
VDDQQKPDYQVHCSIVGIKDLKNHPANMKWLPLALAFVAPSQAALRFGCSTLSIQRIDPLVEPGKTPSAHLHQIVGGNAFNATMSGDVGEQGTCTTCTFSEDFSNYWTAVMFFKHPNGTYKRVPIMQNTALPNGINGGMTVYYTQQDFSSNGKDKITAFKPVSVLYPQWKYLRLTASGLPHGCWQSRYQHSGRRKRASRSSLRLSRKQGN